MKIYGQLLALCALQTASAFTVQTSLNKPAFALRATPDSITPRGENLISGDGGASDPWNPSNLPPAVRCEGGGTRRTWSFGDINQEVVQVLMTSGGRPINSDIEVWIGPDWTPLKLNCYSEDGQVRPIKTLIGTRNKAANIEVRNTGAYEFPLNAACSYAAPPLDTIRDDIPATTAPHYVEGGAVYSVPFDPMVEQVQVLLNTETRQLNAKVEILNGPNNPKQTFQVFTNNGVLNSLYVVFNAPGGGNVVRVTNIAPLEFPCKAYISAV